MAENKIKRLKIAEYTQPEGESDSYSFKKECRTFTTEASVVGLKYITDSESNVIRRTIWALLVIGGFVFATFQIVQQIRYYVSDPTVVNIQINDEEFVPFPTVTICNENIMSIEKVDAADPTGELAGAIKAAFPPLPEAAAPSDDMDALETFKNLNVSDWKAQYQNLYVDIRQELVLCKFGGADCDPSYITTVVREMGQCLQFNPYGNLTLTEPGAGAGLKMYLNAQQSDYLLLSTPTAGFRILMHHHEEPALMNLWGFNVNVNQFSNMQISYKRTKSLPKPFGNCTEAKNYKFNDCAQECLKSYILKHCDCAYDYMDGQVSCSPAQVITCTAIAENNYTTSKVLSKQCGCKPQCEETTFPFTVTSGDFADYFVNWLSPIVNSSAANIRKDFAVLSIYFSRIESEFVETKQAYTLVTLLCDIGGALGLILGSTVLTAFEFGDFLLVSLWKSKQKKAK